MYVYVTLLREDGQILCVCLYPKGGTNKSDVLGMLQNYAPFHVSVYCVMDLQRISGDDLMSIIQKYPPLE